MRIDLQKYLHFPEVSVYYPVGVALSFPPGMLAIAQALRTVSDHLFYEQKTNLTAAEFNIEGFKDDGEVWEVLIVVQYAGLSQNQKQEFSVHVIREGNFDYQAQITEAEIMTDTTNDDDKRIINQFLHNCKQYSDELQQLEVDIEPLNKAVLSKQNAQKELVINASEKMGLKNGKSSSELLRLLDGEIWHDGTGCLYRLEVDEYLKMVLFRSINCYGTDLKEYCGQIGDDG